MTRTLRDGRIDPRPLLRGVLHQWAAPASALGGVALVLLASSTRARFAVLIYAIALTAMFATSGVYHRVWWSSAQLRAWMRRADHSTIFLAIAGTYTPFGLLVLEDPIATLVLTSVWLGGLVGMSLNVVWLGAPRWMSAVAYVAVGWAGLAALPQLWENAGALVTALVVLGGLLYSAGALVYAWRRPDPLPASFGYHELFHALVLAAAAVQFAAVADVVTG